MNKAYRVIRNVARNSAVVVGENARTKGKSGPARKALAAAVAALFLAPAAALAQTTPVTGPLTVQQTYGDVNVTVDAAGSIHVTTTGSTQAVYVSGAPYTSTFTNNGTIIGEITSGGWYYAYGVYFDGDLSGALVNTNLIKGVGVGTSGSAYGVYVSGNLSGSLTNSGTITGSSTGPTSSAYAYGVYVGGDLSGILTNTSTGSISAVANNDDNTAFAAGVYVSGNLSGTLSNAGTISATANQSSSYAYAYGVYVGNNLTGTLNNSGTISATANATYPYYAEAYGVRIGGDLAVGGKIINSGTISATAKGGDGESIYAYGVRIGGDLAGTLTNTSTGTISATANTIGSTNGYPYAFGVSVGGELSGTLSNAGTISATASGSHPYTAYAYGVYVGGHLSGSLTNAGTIGATATGNTSYAYAFGVYVGGDLTGTLTNTSTGTINATASVNSDSSAYAYGVYVNGSLTGTLSNAGTIRATATNGTYSAYAYGVYVGSDLTGTLTNSGTISAVATVDTGRAYAFGAYVAGNLSGQLTNSGTISAAATVTGDGRYAYAYGVYVNNELSGTLNNTSSGTIRATATAALNTDYSAYAYGVYVGNSLSGTLTNAGTIEATATDLTYGAYAYGVFVGSDITSTGVLTNSGTIRATASNANNASSYAMANGVRVSGSLAGTLTNTSSGTISATATGGEYYVTAVGVYVNNSLSGTLNNAGTISATANKLGTDTRYAKAEGIFVSTLAGSGTLTNSGTVSATINSAGSGYAGGIAINQLDGGGALTNTSAGVISATANAAKWGSAYGIGVWGTLAGTLTNAGTIRATATGGTGGSAYGVYANQLNGTVSNSGTISATGAGAVASAEVYSVFAGGGSGTVDNLAGGLLDGRVALFGTVNLNNAGTINTRLENSTVGGNYIQAATGVLEIGATSNTAFGKMTVTGTANLAAGTGIRVTGASGNTLAAGTLSGVVTSGGLTYSSATVNDNILAVNYVAVQNGNNLDLTATATGLTTVVAALGGSGGTVGGVLDNLLANIDNQPAELKTFLNSLGSATTQQGVADAVDKIKPLIAGASTQAVIGTSGSTGNTVVARLENVQGRASGDKFFGDKHFWLKPFGSWADQDNRGGVTGYSSNTAGMVGGADAEVGDGNRLGVAFGYARSKIDGNSTAAPQNATIDSYQLVAYGSRKLGPTTDLNFQAGLGLHDNVGRRTINVGPGFQARSDYSSVSGSLGVGVAHTVKWSESTSFTPSLRADYTTVHNKAYAETGAGALNLNVNSNDVGKFIVAADGKITRALSDKTKLTANLGLGYDLINNRSSVTSAFAGAPTAAFSTQGIDSKPWLIRGGLGVVMRASERVEVNARYDVEGRTGFTNQTASVRVRWAF